MPRTQTNLKPRTGSDGTKLFVMFGQSNMTGPKYSVAGIAANPAYPIGHRLRTHLYLAQNGALAETGFTTKESLWDSSYDSNGPENAFAAGLIDGGYYDDVYIAKYTANGTGLAADWLPNNYGIRDAAPTLVNNALAKLRAWHSNVTVAGIFWGQGANDAAAADRAAAYQANLETLMADFQSNIDGGIDVPLVILESPRWPYSSDNSAGRAYGAEVRAAQAAFVAAQPDDRLLISSASAAVGPDNVHWTAQAVDDMGAATAAAWINNFE